MLRLLICLITTSAAMLLPAPLSAEDVSAEPAATKTANEQEATSAFRIEDTKTRVSLASVKLSVSDLKSEAGQLTGEYKIRVPLMSSSNDHGRIVLPLTSTIEELAKNGGVLRGQAISHKEGTTPNVIVCEIIPDKNQKVLLNITTDDRTLKFKSSYSVVEIAKDS